jgi:hypothetical protein
MLCPRPEARFALPLLLCLVAQGCGDAAPPEPVCSRVGYFSVMSIDLLGFGAQFGGAIPLLLDACPEDLECETVRLRPSDCQAEPASQDGRCDLGADGALHVELELPYPVDVVGGEHELGIFLRREDGTPFAAATSEVLLDVQYADGERCGPTHALGRLEIGPDAWSAGPGTH